jgi:hypothetical protein
MAFPNFKRFVFDKEPDQMPRKVWRVSSPASEAIGVRQAQGTARIP